MDLTRMLRVMFHVDADAALDEIMSCIAAPIKLLCVVFISNL